MFAISADFNTVAADIPIDNGWTVEKIFHRKGGSQAILYCIEKKKGYRQMVAFDFEAGAFVGHLFPPFTKAPQPELAAKVKKLINTPKP